MHLREIIRGISHHECGMRNDGGREGGREGAGGECQCECDGVHHGGGGGGGGGTDTERTICGLGLWARRGGAAVIFRGGKGVDSVK